MRLDQKTFDNLLLRVGSEAVTPGRQGVERRIPVVLIEELLLARDLSAALAIPTRDAFAVARRLLGRSGSSGEVALDGGFHGSLHVGEFIQLGADLTGLRATLQARLESAVETVVRRPRGRPPKAANARRES